MKKRKVEIDIKDYPEELHVLLLAGNVYDRSNSSSARTLYCDAGYYIKIDDYGKLASEASLGAQFHARGLGVEVVHYYSCDRDYLVTRSAAGENLTHYLAHPKKVCNLLASALRKLHSQPIGAAPISPRFQRYMDSANGDFSGGCYDEGMMMRRFKVSSKEEAWHTMQENKGRFVADTLIHGDACLPNVICQNDDFSAFVDFNLSGAGDKHIDLYLAIWSLQYYLKTEAYTDYFLDQYGRDNFDLDMLNAAAAFEIFG